MFKIFRGFFTKVKQVLGFKINDKELEEFKAQEAMTSNITFDETISSSEDKIYTTSQAREMGYVFLKNKGDYKIYTLNGKRIKVQ